MCGWVIGCDDDNKNFTDLSSVYFDMPAHGLEKSLDKTVKLFLNGSGQNYYINVQINSKKDHVITDSETRIKYNSIYNIYIYIYIYIYRERERAPSEMIQ